MIAAGSPVRVTAGVSLRCATADDVDQVYRWRNNPCIVALSLGQRTVDYETHVKWFNESLTTDQRILRVIQAEHGEPVGLVRLDLVEVNMAEVTIYLDSAHSGRGIGTEVLRAVGGVGRRNWAGLDKLIAYIRRDNKPSISAFTKARFQAHGDSSDDTVVAMMKEGLKQELTSAENEENIRVYTDQAERFGKTVAALGWSSDTKQELRFRVLSEIGIGQNASVLDVGCGFGDFSAWLRARGYQGEYTGVDITKSLLLKAEEAYPGEQFHEADVLADGRFRDAQYDYVVASGIFTYRVKGGLEYVQRMAARMLELSRVGCAFNCLSAWGSHTEDTEFTASPSVVLEVCRELTPWVSLRHDYHHGDLTVYLFHGERGEGS